MKIVNLKAKLIADGFNNIQSIGSNVKVNIGFMAKDWKEKQFGSENARFDDLKLSLMNWCSIHNVSGKREGGAFIVYGE